MTRLPVNESHPLRPRSIIYSCPHATPVAARSSARASSKAAPQRCAGARRLAGVHTLALRAARGSLLCDAASLAVRRSCGVRRNAARCVREPWPTATPSCECTRQRQSTGWVGRAAHWPLFHTAAQEPGAAGHGQQKRHTLRSPYIVLLATPQLTHARRRLSCKTALLAAHTIKAGRPPIQRRALART